MTAVRFGHDRVLNRKMPTLPEVSVIHVWPSIMRANIEISDLLQKSSTKDARIKMSKKHELEIRAAPVLKRPLPGKKHFFPG